MKIAVYTIALNEAHFVERWAESCKEADFRFIFDTGSTDDTVMEAAKHGVDVWSGRVKPWRFDDARNAALAMLPDDIDYCISLDMDEILIPGWREELEKLDPTKVTRPRYQYTWSWIDEDAGVPGLTFGGDKIHARFGYRWKHPVHEVILPYGGTAEVQEWTSLQMHHHPDHTKSRSQYLPLLKQAVDEDPSDDRNAFYYARELYFYSHFEEATKEFMRHLSLPRAVWPPERAASMRYIARINPGMAEEWLLKAVDQAPKHREGLVELAQLYYRRQDWEQSLRYAEQALAIVEKPLEYLCEDFAWGALPYDLAAIAAYNLEMFDKAKEYGAKAVMLSPGDERLASNLAFYRAR